MLRRAPTDGIECRFAGEHALRTPLLSVRVARWREFVASGTLARDAEAQFRLGWRPEPDTHPLNRSDPVLFNRHFVAFVGVDPTTQRIMTMMSLALAPDGQYEVGGMVDPEFRRLGYGRETLEAVCYVAHRHLGLPALRAVCEQSNEPSRRWLTASGFRPVAGPPQHVLPDGRVIQSQWWSQVDATPSQRCRRW